MLHGKRLREQHEPRPRKQFQAAAVDPMDKILKDSGLDRADWLIYWKFFWIAEKDRKAAGVPGLSAHEDLFAWWIGSGPDPELVKEFEGLKSRMDIRKTNGKG